MHWLLTIRINWSVRLCYRHFHPLSSLLRHYLPSLILKSRWVINTLVRQFMSIIFKMWEVVRITHPRFSSNLLLVSFREVESHLSHYQFFSSIFWLELWVIAWFYSDQMASRLVRKRKQNCIRVQWKLHDHRSWRYSCVLASKYLKRIDHGIHLARSAWSLSLLWSSFFFFRPHLVLDLSHSISEWWWSLSHHLKSWHFAFHLSQQDPPISNDYWICFRSV